MASLITPLLGFLALLHGASAQASTAYTDAHSGITFQGYTAAGATIGIAAPETVESDFIAQISANLSDSKGWAGMTFGTDMINSLLLAAYPDGKGGVVASLRQTGDYGNPSVLESTATASLHTIAKGTFVNSTAFQYTFLCKGCIMDNGWTFKASDSSQVFGYAISDQVVQSPTDPSSPLNHHRAASIMAFDLESAKSSKYSTWAAMAATAGGVTVGGNSSGNSTSGGTMKNSTATVSNTTWDIIVCGGGPSGIVVAERLAEKGHSVLLLERGPASSYSSGGDVIVPWNDTVTAYDVPAYSFYLSEMEKASANFCPDTPGRAGCLLGGGTEVNALLFVRPPKRDFDDKWPTGWKWNDVSAAAERLYERNPGTILPSADGKYYDQAAFDILSKHFKSNGWKQVNALEEPDEKHMMFTHTPYNVHNGQRSGPVKTYLPLAQRRQNFKLQLHTQVIRAVRTNSTITGVEVETGDGSRQIININTGGKVILSAGSMSTPRILFRSGIGPEAQINNVLNGTTQVILPPKSAWIGLPVGKTIQDHPIWWTSWNVTKSSGMANMTSLSQEDLTNPNSQNTALFAQGSGPLVQSDQRLDLWTSITNKDGSVRYVQGTTMSTQNGTVNIIVYLTHGLTSTGELGITAQGSTTFLRNPWMQTEGDKEAVATFMDMLLDYSRKDGSLITYSGDKGTTGKQMAAVKPQSSVHYLGTARMGTDDGREKGGRAVVDLDTKVYGTDNLFVVDGSIHPDMATGNTQVIVMVVAEKAAERILAYGGGGEEVASSSAKGFGGRDGGKGFGGKSFGGPRRNLEGR